MNTQYAEHIKKLVSFLLLSRHAAGEIEYDYTCSLLLQGVSSAVGCIVVKSLHRIAENNIFITHLIVMMQLARVKCIYGFVTHQYKHVLQNKFIT